MNAGPFLFTGSIGAVFATLLGVAFFFVIIGVFGLSASIAALILFLSLAGLIFRRPQDQQNIP